MSSGTVFINCSQPVRLPKDVRLPEGAHKADVRAMVPERIISPVGQVWDNFFLDGPAVTEDFMAERSSQHQSDREAL